MNAFENDKLLTKNIIEILAGYNLSRSIFSSNTRRLYSTETVL